MSCLWKQFQDEMLDQKTFTKNTFFCSQFKILSCSTYFFLQNSQPLQMKSERVVSFLPKNLKLHSPWVKTQMRPKSDL